METLDRDAFKDFMTISRERIKDPILTIIMLNLLSEIGNLW